MAARPTAAPDAVAGDAAAGGGGTPAAEHWHAVKRFRGALQFSVLFVAVFATGYAYGLYTCQAMQADVGSSISMLQAAGLLVSEGPFRAQNYTLARAPTPLPPAPPTPARGHAQESKEKRMGERKEEKKGGGGGKGQEQEEREREEREQDRMQENREREAKNKQEEKRKQEKQTEQEEARKKQQAAARPVGQTAPSAAQTPPAPPAPPSATASAASPSPPLALTTRKPVSCETKSIFRSGTNIQVQWAGRMGNNLIQYLHSRLLADKMKFGVTHNNNKRNWQFASFPQVQFPSAGSGAKTLPHPKTCSDVGVNIGTDSPIFKQNYLFYQHDRDKARCLLAPSAAIDAKLPKMGEHDIVIHYRDGSNETPQHGQDSTVPSLEYFTHIIDSLASETGDSTIHFLTEPRHRQHRILKALMKKYPKRVVVSQGSPEMDIALGMHAPILIICTETFGWLMAYLTTARRIYMVYESRLERGAKHCPLVNLFIHDDPRVRYYDVVNNGKKVVLETAEEVMRKETKFSANLRRRRNPCAPMLGQ